VGGSFSQQSPDSIRNLVSLSEELGSRILGNNGSENLVADGWENFEFVVMAKPVVNGVDFVDLGVEENTDGE
jgi:hypothetical protein